MSLWPDLADAAKKILTDMQQGGSPSQTEVKQMFYDSAALNPAGLVGLQWNSIYVSEFAKVIDDNRDELRPWILVNPAALGALGPFSAVLNQWSREALPGDLTTLDPEVTALLESLFEGYVRMIGTEDLS